jgi:hypothetical protein
VWPTEGNKELQNATNCLEHITSELDLNILRRIVTSAGSKSPDEHSINYLQSTLKQRVESLDETFSKITVGKIISLLKAINLVLTNR